MTNARLARRDLLRYGVLAAPIAFAGLPLYVYAPDYYATQYDASLLALGLVLLGIRSIDAIQDPLIGRLSDRFHHRRLPIMMFAALLLGAGVAGVFHPMLPQHTLIWFAGSMVLATTAFSILSINLNTIGGLWSRDTHAKTRIASYRELFGILGLLVAVLLPGILMQQLSSSTAFSIFSAVLLVWLVLAIIMFAAWYRARPLPKPGRPPSPAMTHWRRTMASNKSLLSIYAVSMLASSIPALLVIFFIRDRLQAEDMMGPFLAAYFLSAGLAMPLWERVSRSRDKWLAWGLGMLMAIISFVWAYALESGDVWQYALICVLSGAGLGADLVLPPSILADRIHATASEEQAATQYAALTFLQKFALALSSFMVLPLLEMAGYQPDNTNDQPALQALSLTYALIPCAIKLLAVAMLWRVRIRQSHDTSQQGESHDQTIHPVSHRSLSDA